MIYAKTEIIKRCIDCKSYKGGKECDLSTRKVYFSDRNIHRPKWCPLVEVKEFYGKSI